MFRIICANQSYTQPSDSSLESANSLAEVAGLLAGSLPILLPDVEHAVGGVALTRVHILAPLLQSPYFFCVVHVLTSFRLNDVVLFGRHFHDEVGIVVGDASVGVAVVDLEMDRKIILHIRHNVFAVLKEAHEFKLEVAITNDFVKYALF